MTPKQVYSTAVNSYQFGCKLALAEKSQEKENALFLQAAEVANKIGGDAARTLIAAQSLIDKRHHEWVIKNFYVRKGES